MINKNDKKHKKNCQSAHKLSTELKNEITSNMVINDILFMLKSY